MSKEKILIIDDEASIRSSLQGILEDEGYLRQDRGIRGSRPGGPEERELRPRPAGHLAARNERSRGPREIRPERTAPGHHDFGSRDDRDGRQGDQAGRLRFSRKAPLPGESRPHRPERPPPDAARGREYPAPGKARRPVPAHRKEPGHPEAPARHPAGRAFRRPRPRSTGKTGRAGSTSPPSSISRAGGAPAVSSGSTARPSPTISSRTSSSATPREPSRTRSRTRRASSSWPTAGPCSSTRSGT